MTKMTGPTPQQILDTPMWENSAKAATIRDYLIRLLADLWRFGSDFSSKRPFGFSDWQFTVYADLVRAGWVAGTFDEDGCLDDVNVPAADELIRTAIQALGGGDDV